jgi:hypothetical protein
MLIAHIMPICDDPLRIMSPPLETCEFIENPISHTKNVQCRGATTRVLPSRVQPCRGVTTRRCHHPGTAEPGTAVPRCHHPEVPPPGYCRAEVPPLGYCTWVQGSTTLVLPYRGASIRVLQSAVPGCYYPGTPVPVTLRSAVPGYCRAEVPPPGYCRADVTAVPMWYCQVLPCRGTLAGYFQVPPSRVQPGNCHF